MDYTGKDDDRSLRWRRNDRVDFDLCANSPPSDGFFYASHARIESKPEEGCEKIYAKNIPKEIGGQIAKSSFAPGNYSSAAEMQGGGGGENTGKVLKMDAVELEHWAKSNIRGHHSSDDTAPTPIDHLPQFQRVVPTVEVTNATGINNSGGGGGSSLVDKLQQAQQQQSTLETTPYSTPNITPACSPQVPRRGVVSNPFFTGLQERKKDEGSWLFKSPGNVVSDYQQYEARVGIQPATNETQPNNNKKNVRYVPKPSQLRELNFFSPTSS